MSLHARSICLVLRTIIFLNTLSAILLVTATPIPLPLPLMAVDYPNSFGLVSVNRSTPQITSGKLDALQQRRPSMRSDKYLRSQTDTLADLYQYYDAANGNADVLRDLASQSANVDNDDYDFQQQYASGLTGFTSNISGFQAAFARAASDKGLANYDRTNDIETLLKNTVNVNKNVLSSTDVVVYNLPAVGSTLGPIVYDLKCLIDGILNSTEDYGDATINQLTPLLQSLLGKVVSTACKSGVVLAGLCL